MENLLNYTGQVMLLGAGLPK